ncbi:cystine ABC transporter, cystine-binding protein [uncultured Rubrobacteraceae bacterium]|uniref:Cystine ABC transporter, cystine-binding protein n=1 Tax=uncultured Rubrobacteraceae bacterium TaxID=349277 RepID=A0A6J4PP83_9ACTN|nr:cystine ABC transporter, cystine-binding protein [uncultured Rubrobacteraceae bacterium]
MNLKRNPGRLASLAVALVALMTVTACGGGGSAGGGDGGGGGGNLLQEIKDRGVLRASTDPAYPPQSFQNEQGEFEGFDIDVTEEIAKRMGVEVEWMTPSWDVITAGSWNGRWDLSVGSMTITPDRAEVLYFTPAYYYTPAATAVHESNTDITNLETDLDGKRVGVGTATTYEQYLDGSLDISGDFEYLVDDPQVQTYDTDSSAIQDLALGDGIRLDAAMSSLTTLEEAKDSGTPIKIVGDPLYYEPLAVAVDRESPANPKPLVDEVSKIVEEMHKDGTLTELSEKWYDGIDLTKKQGA